MRRWRHFNKRRDELLDRPIFDFVREAHVLTAQ